MQPFLGGVKTWFNVIQDKREKEADHIWRVQWHRHEERNTEMGVGGGQTWRWCCWCPVLGWCGPVLRWPWIWRRWGHVINPMGVHSWHTKGPEEKWHWKRGWNVYKKLVSRSWEKYVPWNTKSCTSINVPTTKVKRSTCLGGWIVIAHVASCSWRRRTLVEPILLTRWWVGIAGGGSGRWAVAVHHTRWRIAVGESPVLCWSSTRS